MDFSCHFAIVIMWLINDSQVTKQQAKSDRIDRFLELQEEMQRMRKWLIQFTSIRFAIWTVWHHLQFDLDENALLKPMHILINGFCEIFRAFSHRNNICIPNTNVIIISISKSNHCVSFLNNISLSEDK